MYNNRNCK